MPEDWHEPLTGCSPVDGVEDEVGVGAQLGPIADLVERPADLVQVVRRHLQRRLVGLVGGQDHVVDARLVRHLDVAAQDVGDGT